MLDQWFDADTLVGLRRAVLAAAVAAGIPHDRANDVVLAVHELAANAVCHGGGTGRLEVQVADGALRCHVSDAGRAATDGPARMAAMVAVRPWQLQHGHGLWLVRRLADQLAIAPSATGSQVTAVFTLPDHGRDPGDLRTEAAAQIRVERRGGACLLRISGELDLITADSLGERADAAVEQVPGPVLVDLAGLTFIDARAARALDARASLSPRTQAPPAPPGRRRCRVPASPRRAPGFSPRP